jgi:uncharacterized membrane protein
MRILFAVLVMSWFVAGDTMAVAADMEDASEPLRVVEEPMFWEQFLGGSSVILGFVALLFGLVVLVMWVVVPFLVNGIYENVKAMRKGMEEERLVASSQRAAQLAHLKIIAEALSGAQIDRAQEAPVVEPSRERLPRFGGR